MQLVILEESAKLLPLCNVDTLTFHLACREREFTCVLVTAFRDVDSAFKTALLHLTLKLCTVLPHYLTVSVWPVVLEVAFQREI